MNRRLTLLLAVVLPLVLALGAATGCRKAEPPPAPVSPAVAPADAVQAPPAPPVPPPLPARLDFDRLERADFNRLAAELFVPLFWVGDRDDDRTADPDELAEPWGMRQGRTERWLNGTAHGPDFAPTYQQLLAVHEKGHPIAQLEPDERARRAAVLAEVRQGRPTLLLTDLRGAPAEDQTLVRHVVAAAAVVERIYAKQNGSFGMQRQIPADDATSRALFFRNQGPWCEAPATEKDPACNALPGRPPRRSGLYPLDLQEDPKFCETLAARKDAKTLLSPFVLVSRDAKGELSAVPYHEAYADEVQEVAKELRAAADALVDPKEAPFQAYLRAAAQAFLDGNWPPADEAWARMSVHNSRWYLRIGPDETYFEPCSRKAGFHVSFARVNQDSLRWQRLLEPVRTDLEQAIAKLAGPPYRARKVSFHLPDFIDIVVNAGDSRSALGATVGQSLPNWGPVANEGRGRTVAMTNVGTDPDSRASTLRKVESLYCKASLSDFTTEAEPQVMATVLHEAAHNLGPAHEYQVQGKTDDEIFGGPLAATLEELKSQQAALYLADWLVDRQLVTDEARRRSHSTNVAWAMGHVSQGMTTPEGKPKPYSQLAAIQLGALLEAGAITWQAEAKAANGQDVGCFQLDLAKFPAANAALMARVAGIKGRGDKKAAEALRGQFVDAPGPWATLRETIRERWLREPKASYLYAVQLDEAPGR